MLEFDAFDSVDHLFALLTEVAESAANENSKRRHPSVPDL